MDAGESKTVQNVRKLVHPCLLSDLIKRAVCVCVCVCVVCVCVCVLIYLMKQYVDCVLLAIRFCKQSDENKRQKVALILDKLITMTIEEVEVCTECIHFAFVCVCVCADICVSVCISVCVCVF